MDIGLGEIQIFTTWRPTTTHRRAYTTLIGLCKCTEKKYFSLCSKFPENFPSKSWSNLLDGPCGSFNGTHFLSFLSPFLPCASWPVSIEAEFDDQTLSRKCSFKMVQNCSMGPMFGGFVTLGCEARPFVLALIGYFGQNMGLIPGHYWFCQKIFTIFVFFEILL